MIYFSFRKKCEVFSLFQVVGIPKIKTDQSVPHFDPLQNEQIQRVQESPKPALPKNETPNRFWAFVEPYCAPITAEDIKVSLSSVFLCATYRAFSDIQIRL